MGQTNQPHPHPTPRRPTSISKADNLALNSIPSSHLETTKKKTGQKEKKEKTEKRKKRRKKYRLGASRQRGKPHSFSSPYSSSRTDSTTRILKDGNPPTDPTTFSCFLSPFAPRSSPERQRGQKLKRRNQVHKLCSAREVGLNTAINHITIRLLQRQRFHILYSAC